MKKLILVGVAASLLGLAGCEPQIKPVNGPAERLDKGVNSESDSPSVPPVSGHASESHVPGKTYSGETPAPVPPAQP